MSAGTARSEILDALLGAVGNELQFRRSEQLARGGYGQFSRDHTRGEQLGNFRG